MKFLLLLLIFFATTVKAQNNLSFDHRFVESENKWVALKGKNDTLSFGFIYIDAQAGLTLNFEGTFTIASDGKFVADRPVNNVLKIRLQHNNVKVAVIPSSKYNDLGITEYPDWLKNYLHDTASIARLYRWGFLYNGYDECAKALTYLERAEKIDPKYKGLAVELAFSYNCLGQYDRAITILKDAIVADPTDAYTYKELVYAQMKSGQIDKAAETCKKAIEVCTDKTYNGEMCYNVLHEYFMKKDKKNFAAWVDETRKWTSSNADLTASIKGMEDELAK